MMVGVVDMGHDFEMVWEMCAPVVDGGGAMRGDSGWRNYWNDISSELFWVGSVDWSGNRDDGGGVFETESGSGGARRDGGDDVGVCEGGGGAARRGICEGAL